MNNEPVIIRAPFCIGMLVVGLVNMALSAIVAASNLSHGNVPMLALNVATLSVSACVIAANVYFVAQAVARWWWKLGRLS